MTKQFLALAVCAMITSTASAGKPAPSVPCASDPYCVEVTVLENSSTLNVNVAGDATPADSAYRDYRASGGDPCVLAEYRKRYNLLWLHVSRNSVEGCDGARYILVRFPAEICDYLTSGQGGFQIGDGYMEAFGDGCRLRIQGRSMNPRIRIDGFVPGPADPQAGDVGILFLNPKFNPDTGVDYSSFAVYLVDAPKAQWLTAPDRTQVTYTGQALLQTFVNGKLNSRLNRNFGPFALEFAVSIVP
jgi:hypothetical protein